MEQEDRCTDKPSELLDAQGPRALGIEAATVAGAEPDAEVSLIGQQQWQAIHQRRAAGMNVSTIARELELDRKTVRSCLAQPMWQPYRREPATPTMLDAHRAWLVQRAPQVHYSARILWQELRGQRGFTGCYETVKLAVRPLRAAAAVAALTQCRFETAPGEQAQVDWGQITVPLGSFTCTKYVLQDKDNTMTYWMAPGVPIPVKMTQTDIVTSKVTMTMDLVGYS